MLIANDHNSESTRDRVDSARTDEGPSPLRSVFSASVSDILQELAISLLVSTYQAGYVICLRADAQSLNTHFRMFPRPMGMTVSQGRLAVGSARQVTEFWNMEAMARKLEPAEKHDACYLPRTIHLTGDIDVHEMAYGRAESGESTVESQQEELWFVNTRFSCLCTLDTAHSFVPQWRPPFVSALSPDDRCHLNGLALVDDQPRFVTALGATNEREGWRKKKTRGGVLVDVQSGEIVCANLSMPHSPRWHDGRLWMLESGDGSIGKVDLDTGKYEAAVKLNGFTRGVSFHGPFAFIGLSQVRESAIFSGIPITERMQDRVCGVSIVHLPSAREVGFVHFQDAVQEIFAVEILPHRYPDLLEPTDDHLGNAYALPDEALPDVARKGLAQNE